MVVIDTQAKLAEITSREVSRYVATSGTMRFYALLDDDRRIYAVVIVPAEDAKRPAWVFVLARIVDDMIVIEEDGPEDKPLYQALMVNGGVPREKIILAYKGETIPVPGG